MGIFIISINPGQIGQANVKSIYLVALKKEGLLKNQEAWFPT